LGRDIDRPSGMVRPADEPLFADLRHPIHHRPHPMPMKDWLDNAPVPLPHLPRTGHQPITED
jgi:hypothetical protein